MFSERIDENLELRLVSERFAQDLHETVRANLAHLQNWLPWATDDYSLESAKGFIKLCLEGIAKNEFPSYFIFFENELAGGIGFNNVNPVDQNAEIGYWLAEKFQGRGIATKCCRKIIENGFEKLNLNRIVIRCATENIKSRAIPERLGLKKEGIAREAAKLNGEFKDLIVYSILKEEWENI